MPVRIDDTAWTERWAKTPYRPRPRNFARAVNKLRRRSPGFMGCGTEEEPESSLWMASLSEAMGDRFAEGVRVLDYGCGVGRYAHFLRQRLSRFTYYGLENPGGDQQHGEECIAVARKLIGADKRVVFDVVGSSLEAAAIGCVDVVVLGSVFTHLDRREVQSILERLAPVVERGDLIVFSVFLDDRDRLEGPGAYGFPGCYERAWLTREQLSRIAQDRRWTFHERGTFLAQGVNLHRIFAASLS